ncbi:protein C3orf33 homolog isoform X1 [Physeter macrocephalus]|uniref:Protein C3orf33 homolog isoform X1 n=1 Tax=Physeter macrocephalus TaxID=9755 RepID=A0A2Y9SUI6_PHYMC|nr:protein C3orf33 homolog isoform X1 [Physeter catodon]|eukprot:XP_023980150.1 protein C3orf33 homolog isoform X1 [Physeter catodon]
MGWEACPRPLLGCGEGDQAVGSDGFPSSRRSANTSARSRKAAPPVARSKRRRGLAGGREHGGEARGRRHPAAGPGQSGAQCGGVDLAMGRRPPASRPGTADPPAGQNISTVMAIAGVMLLLRSVRLTSKFTSSSDIPVEFIRRNVKLRGRLRRITENGLEIEHIPITLPIISSWRKEPCGALLVKLAGVELTETGKVWLQKELKPSQVVWFQLLGKENSALFCYLLVNKGRYFSVSLNEEILRRGLGKTVLVKGLNYDSKIYWRIHRNLLKAELIALKKGEGIWKEESEKESYLEKFKGSWREIWKKDSYFKKIGSDFNLKKESYYDKFRRTYETWKENMNNYSLLLKFRELLSRIHFRRKG